MNQTVFGDLRRNARAVYRVKTHGSTYIVGVHDEDDRKYVIVRGEAGGDRENLVIRDTDPRVGSRSLFDVPLPEWVGRQLQVASMTSSTIIEATLEADAEIAALVAAAEPPRASRDSPPAVGWGPPPPGMSQTPAIVQIGGKGTHPGAVGAPAVAAYEAKREVLANANLARDVVVGDHRPELVYPQRHVRHAEDAAALLRSVARRDRIFEDVAFHRDRELLTKLRKALEECARLAAQIRARDSK